MKKVIIWVLSIIAVLLISMVIFTPNTIVFNMHANDTSNDYKITKCCYQGTLGARTSEGQSSYSDEKIIELLKKLYSDNCFILEKYPRQQVFLDFPKQSLGAARNNLIYYKETGNKILVVNGNTLNESFKEC